MIVPQDGQGDVLCGAYDDSNVTNVTDEDNIDWTEISTTDVYTGDDFSAVFVEADAVPLQLQIQIFPLLWKVSI